MESFVLVVCILYTISGVYNFIKGIVLEENSLKLQGLIDSSIAMWGWTVYL
jgi:hypothetical protein